jgi:hypothetical protein
MNITIRSHSLKLIALAGVFGFSGCATEIGPDGQPHSVITPVGAAALQTITAAGIGAGTGALLRGVNPVAAGAISAGAGSIGSQAIDAVILYSQQQATLQQKKTAEIRAQHLYEKMNEQEKAQVKSIAVVTNTTDSSKGVPIMYVDPKTMQVKNNTVYNCNKMPQGPTVKSSDVAVAFN